MDYRVNGVRVGLHDETLSLRRLGCGTRRWLDNGAAGAALWQVHAVNAQGCKVDLDGASATRTSATMEADTLVLEWAGVKDADSGAGPFDVRVTMAPSAAGPNLGAWRLHVRNRSRDWTIWHCLFPCLGGIKAGKDAGNDRYFYPEMWGRESRGWEAMRDVSGTCGGYGLHAMQFMGFTRGDHTLYLGAHDPAHWQKKMHFRPGASADRARKAAMHIEAYPPGMTEAGNDYEQPYDMVVGEVAGNWYDAARVYGAFARRQPWACQPPPKAHQGPREAREVLVWEQASVNASPVDRVVSINKKKPADWVAEMIALREKLGVRIVVHLYHWHQAQFDTDYPDYFPIKRGLKKVIADLKRADVLVMPYINGRLFDQAAPSYGPEAELHAEKISAQRVNPKTLYAWPESYGNGQLLTGMCMHSAYWRRIVVDLCRRIVKDLGCGGVYLDQLGCFGGRTCLDPRHGHPLGGGAYWLEGMRRMVAEIREAIGAEPLLTTECNWEGCVADFDGLLDTQWNHADNVPLFPAVYGGLGSIYGGDVFGGTYANEGETFVQRMGMRFVWGGQFGWGNFEPLLEKGNKALLDYFATLCRLRKEYGRFFCRGEFLRPPEVRLLADGTLCDRPLAGPVLGAMWADPDAAGQAAVFLVNVTRKVQRVQVRIRDTQWLDAQVQSEPGASVAAEAAVQLAPLTAMVLAVARS